MEVKVKEWSDENSYCTRDEYKEDLLNTISDDLVEWKELYEEGCTDPNYTDGENLNFVRSRIENCMSSLYDYFEPKEIPEWIFSVNIPEKVSDSYMANADQIRKDYDVWVNKVKNDADYKWLKKRIPQNHLQKIELELISRATHYTNYMDVAVQKDDVHWMKHRLMDSEYPLEKLHDARVYIEKEDKCKKELKIKSELLTIKCNGIRHYIPYLKRIKPEYDKAETATAKAKILKGALNTIGFALPVSERTPYKVCAGEARGYGFKFNYTNANGSWLEQKVSWKDATKIVDVIFKRMEDK